MTRTRTTEKPALPASALWYAKRVAIFPATPGEKIPLPGSAGLKDATTDLEKITQQWQANPNANIAMITGQQNNIWVLDIDAHKDGENTLHALEVRYGKLPDTVEVLTPHGGRHLWFKWPSNDTVIRNSAGKVGLGIDVRGEGGYVIAPPSCLANGGGAYAFEASSTFTKVEIAEAPQWLLNLVCEKKHKPPNGNGEETIKEGSRNAKLTSIAGAMRHQGMTPTEIELALKAVNNNRCKPPLSEKEVAQIAHSVGRYEPGALPNIDELARMPALEYEPIRKQKAKELNIRPSVLDEAVKKLRAKQNPGDGLPNEPEPWPYEVDGAALLDTILATLKRFIAFSNEHQAIATTLWIMLTYCHDAADTLARLAPISPMKRCGKTTLLKLLRRMVRCPLITSNTTPAAIFRRIERDHPTLLIDELDSFAEDSNELRGILNSGHDRESAYVDRTVGDNHEPKLFSTWSPMALAKIKDLPDTLQDRSIIIRLQRRKQNDKLTKATRPNLNKYCPMNGEIPQRCARWAADHLENLKSHEPTIPTGLIDRDEDNWFTMLAIAELIGGRWPEQARAAAIELSKTDELDQGVDGLLLADIKQVFDGQSQLKSSDLIEALRLLEGRPWRNWGKNRNIPGLTERDLSKQLKPYDIKPERIYFGGERQRGYRLEWFEPIFDSYLADKDDQEGAD